MHISLPATHVLLPASRKALTRAQLGAVLERKLRNILTRVCEWEDGTPVGDFRFCVLSYAPTRGVQVYMQFWSEPGEAVEWEVSSGNWHEPTKAYMQGDRSKRVKASGFRIGGEARNFQREVDVESALDLRLLVTAAVDLLYDALGYRGRQALEVQAVADTRAPRQPIYASISPSDLVTILERAGFTCDAGDWWRGAAPVLVESDGLRATLLLLSRVKGEANYEAAAIGLAPADGATVDQPFVEDAEVAPLHFFGGVTADWIVMQVGYWFKTVRGERRAARQATETPRVRTATLIH